VFPAFRQIHHNFMLANYNSQEAIDNDDGSSFYHTYSNFFVYGDAGLKSDFGGHDNHHDSNVCVMHNITECIEVVPRCLISPSFG